MIVVALIFATFSALVAYEYIPCWGIGAATHPMFAAGSLATGATMAFVFGVMQALFTRGCITIKKESQVDL